MKITKKQLRKLVREAFRDMEDSHGYMSYTPPEKKWDSPYRKKEFESLSFEEQDAYEEGATSAVTGDDISTNPNTKPYNKHLHNAWELGWYSEMRLPSDRKGY